MSCKRRDSIHVPETSPVSIQAGWRWAIACDTSSGLGSHQNHRVLLACPQSAHPCTLQPSPLKPSFYSGCNVLTVHSCGVLPFATFLLQPSSSWLGQNVTAFLAYNVSSASLTLVPCHTASHEPLVFFSSMFSLPQSQQLLAPLRFMRRVQTIRAAKYVWSQTFHASSGMQKPRLSSCLPIAECCLQAYQFWRLSAWADFPYAYSPRDRMLIEPARKERHVYVHVHVGIILPFVAFAWLKTAVQLSQGKRDRQLYFSFTFTSLWIILGKIFKVVQAWSHNRAACQPEVSKNMPMLFTHLRQLEAAARIIQDHVSGSLGRPARPRVAASLSSSLASCKRSTTKPEPSAFCLCVCKPHLPPASNMYAMTRDTYGLHPSQNL